MRKIENNSHVLNKHETAHFHVETADGKSGILPFAAGRNKRDAFKISLQNDARGHYGKIRPRVLANHSVHALYPYNYKLQPYNKHTIFHFRHNQSSNVTKNFVV